MMKRMLPLLLLLLTGLVATCQLLFAQERPRMGFSRAAFTVDIEGDTLDMDMRKGAYRGNVTLAATIKDAEKGRALYDIQGATQLLTYVHEANAMTVRLETVKGTRPSLVLTDLETKEKTTLTGDVLEYRLTDNALEARGNVRVESQKNQLVITGQSLKSVARADRTIEALTAAGNVAFSGVTEPEKEGGAVYRLDGRAGLASYRPSAAKASNSSGILFLEKGASGPVPQIVRTEVETKESMTLRAGYMEVGFNPYSLWSGVTKRSEAEGARQ